MMSAQADEAQVLLPLKDADLLRQALFIDGRWLPAGGSFCPVMWESMADPVLTGREALGFPKISSARNCAPSCRT
jgi:hypothetical protein